MAAAVSQSVTPSCELRLDSVSRLNAASGASSVVLCSRPSLSSSLKGCNGRSILFGSRARGSLSGKSSFGSPEWGSLGRCCRRPGEAFAKGTDDSFSTGEMTLEAALKLLGVAEGASFDEILGAKKKLVDSSAGDQDRISQLEAAYDTLLMQSLSQRRSGKVLDSSIRYADVRRAKSLAGGGGPDWLKGALQKSPVALQQPTPDTVVLQTGVYGALIIWTFATGLSSSNPAAVAAGADTPGFILAIGFGSSLYFLRKQNIKLGKATLVTIGGLVAGALLGGLVESWLRVDIVPFLGIGSPAIVVSEFVLVSLYLTSLYLR
ncbi:unnamed protein product [Calypogeia fissa]